MKDFKGYAGGLDTTDDHTGVKSFYINFYGHEIMFHVSCFLPYEENAPLQIQRKRHIGNDTVTVVFQESPHLPLDTRTFVSQFQQVVILVRPHIDKAGKRFYQIAYACDKEVPVFGPPLQQNYYPSEEEFRKYFLTLVLNADFAAKQCPKLKNSELRGRDIILNSYVNEKINKKVSFKPEKGNSLLRLQEAIFSGKLPGGSVWSVFLTSYSSASTSQKMRLGLICDLVISQCGLTFFSTKTQEVELRIPTCRVISWSLNRFNEITIYTNGKYSFSFVMCGPDLLEHNNVIYLFDKVTCANASFKASLSRKDFIKYGMETDAFGTVAGTKDNMTLGSFGITKGCFVLKANRLLLLIHGTDIPSKIVSMNEPYVITFAPPLKFYNGQVPSLNGLRLKCELD